MYDTTPLQFVDQIIAQRAHGRNLLRVNLPILHHQLARFRDAGIKEHDIAAVEPRLIQTGHDKRRRRGQVDSVLLLHGVLTVSHDA